MGVLTYLGPYEVAVNTPTVLSGTYRPAEIAKVTASIEDKYGLAVTHRPTQSTWDIQLGRGLSQAGVRWIRLRGLDVNGKTVADSKIYLTVSSTPLIAVDSGTIEIQATTWFKAAPLSSSDLADTQRVRINPGTSLAIRRYALSGNHIAVELQNRLSPVGTFGYIYEPHAQLTVGGLPLVFDDRRLPDLHASQTILWVSRNTLIKLKPESSAVLSPLQRAQLMGGQVFFINGYAPVRNHFRVTLAAGLEIPQFGNAGYVFAPHVKIKRGNRWIAYDAQATTLTMLRSSALKKRPVDSSLLTANEVATLPAWRVYGVSSYAIEAGHLKVSLTEEFPGFGNTGYIFLNHIKLNRAGDDIRLLPTLSYTGPSEVLAKQPITLTGEFNPAEVKTITLSAEGKYPLPISLNTSIGSWETKLNQGFHDAGLRWLRLNATNAQGKAVDSQVIYITVSDDKAIDLGDLSLEILQATQFKVAPVDSDDLTIEQKIDLKPGQTLPVRNYGLVDGHLKLQLNTSLTPVGDFGYIFEHHARLKKGNSTLHFDLEDVPDTPASGQMVVRTTTFFKVNPVDSASLNNNQKVRLFQGQTFGLLGYASTSGHFRVTLSDSIPGFGNIGYVYWRHVSLLQNRQTLAYDPQSLTVTIRQPTALKRKPISSSLLSSADKTTLPLGRVYGVASYETDLESNHVRVSLTEEIPGYGNTGYLFPEHIWLRQGSQTIEVFPQLPKRIELNVPYFSQRNNPRFYWSTCNVTSIAMVLYYYGLRPQYSDQLEDELLQWILTRYGEGAQTDHSVMSQMIRAYGYKTSFSTTRKWSELDAEIAAGHPVVLAGDFTATGHILTVIGYRPEGLIVNDPWGNALTGYRNTEGRKLLYPNAYLNNVCGPNGNIWAHFIEP